MSIVLMPIPKQQFFGANGSPLAGGKVYTYSAGTTTAKATYTNSTGLVANANPVILDSAGRASIWLNGFYKVSVYDSSDVLQYTVDNVSGEPDTVWWNEAEYNNGLWSYFTDEDATPSVASNNKFKTKNTVATTITGFDGGLSGQKLSVIFEDSNTTIDFGTIWDMLDDDCSNLTGWSDADTGSAASTQVTYDSKSCFKFDSGAASEDNDEYARRTRDVGTFGTLTSIEIELYCNAVGRYDASDHFEMAVFNGSLAVLVSWSDSGVKIHGTTVVAPQIVDPEGSWTRWRFDINWTAQTVDVYYADALMESDVAFSYESTTANGTIYLTQYGYEHNSRITHVNSLKVGNMDANLCGNSGADWTPSSGDWMECVFDGRTWFCSCHDCTA